MRNNIDVVCRVQVYDSGDKADAALRALGRKP
jgi:hypothetical protein